MSRQTTVAILSAVVLFASVGAQVPAAPPVTAIRAAGFVDVKTGVTSSPAVLLIDGDRIKAIGTNLAVPRDAKIIELPGITLAPGLIDVHTHLLMNYKAGIGGDDPNMALTIAQMSTAKRALLGAAMAKEDLWAGITSVRDLGNSGLNGDVALRDAIEAGWVQGPRIQPSTRALAAAGGQLGPLSPTGQRLIADEYVVISGVEEARRAVRQALYDGAEVVKVIVNTDPRVVSLDELKTVVDEAHRVGRPVAAHAIGDQATRLAAEAGVDSIEHAYVVLDDVLKMMATKKICLVPTDFPEEYYGPLFGIPAAEVSEFVKGSRDRLRRARAAGVKIAFGSDEYYQAGTRTRGETSLLAFRAYTEAGMSPIDVIRSATMNAAELLRWHDRVGALEVGKLADVIGVEGDPLRDLRAIERIQFVMKGGIVIRNDTASRAQAAGR